MKIAIGKKSLGYQHLLGAVACALLGINVFVMFIYFVEKPTDDIIILFIFIFIPMLTFVFFAMWWIQRKKPYVMISYDDENLYMSLPEGSISISFDQIVQVVPERSYGRGISYSFGHIIVHTEQEHYKVGIISEVEDVSLNIMKQIRRKTM
jgi:hypothetical protein